jgi:hypothetical protein
VSVLTLDEVKEHLGIDLADTDEDVELQRFIDAAESAVGRKCGGIGPATVTGRVDGYSRTLVLPTAPVVSLTSVTPVGGTALDVSSLDLNVAAGVVESLDGSAFTARRYDVVFQSGRTTAPPDLLLAAKELVRHLWLTQRGAAPGSPGALPDGSVDPAAGLSFTWPWRVEQLMAPYLLVDL